MKKLFCCVSLCVFFVACGSSSSGSDEPSSKDSPEVLDSLQNAEAVTDLNSEDYIKASSFDIELIEEDGGSFDDDFEAVQVGKYRWMTSNVSKNEGITTNMCYGDSASNCSEYGRLFKYYYAYEACPGSYHVPSKEDWSNLMDLREKYPELGPMLKLSYGGICSGYGETECSDLGTHAYYLTADSLVANFKKGGSGVSFSRFDMYSYYSLRCVGYVDIVADLQDLPACNESSAQWLDRFYVVKYKSNYYCTGNRWVDDFSDDCDRSQKNVYATFNDSVYVCKNSSWRLATILDSRDECTTSIDSSLIIFNGVRYACEDGFWREFSDTENALGYCNGKRFFDLDSIRKGDGYKVYVCDTTGWRVAKNYDYLGYCGKAQYRTIDTLILGTDSSAYFCDSTGWRLAVNTDYLKACKAKIIGEVDTLKTESGTFLYTCDTTGWRKAVIEDVYGKCDSLHTYKTAVFKGANYVCRDKYWDSFTSLEDSLGVCTPQRQGVIDTVTGGDDYICDQAKWRYTKKEDYLKECTSKRNGEIIRYAGYGYLCKDSSWKQLSKVESELGLCETKKVGKMMATSSGTDYICTETGWKTASMTEVMGECNAKNEGKLGTYGGEKYYCGGAAWLSESRLPELGKCLLSRMGLVKKQDGSTYVCDSTGWRTAKSREIALGSCTAKNADSVKVAKDTAFICKKGQWSMMSVTEYLGACNADNEGEVKSYAKKQYVCYSTGSWHGLDEFEMEHGACVSSVYGTMLRVGSRYYYCYNNQWKQVSTEFGEMGSCSRTDTSTYIRPDSVYFCSKGYWKYVPPVDYLGKCSSATATQKLYGNIVYYCDTTATTAWFRLSAKDSVKGYCKTSLLGKTMTYKDSLFVCTGTTIKSWTPATEKEFLTVCDENREGDTFFNGFNQSKCVDGKIQCLDTKTMTDPRDGQVYKYVELKKGEVWMSEDMRYGGVDSAWCKGELSTSSCSRGMHYTYASTKHVCPEGWHMPTKDEFMYLHQLMRDASSTYEDGKFSNVYGLSMLGNGYLQTYMWNGVEPRYVYIEGSLAAAYWYADDSSDYFSFTKRLDDRLTPSSLPGGGYIPQKSGYRILGLSVRCKKD